MKLPENAGRPWTTEEETKLVRAFEAGVKLRELAQHHGRTRQAIQGRLYRLGKVSQWQLPASSSHDLKAENKEVPQQAKEQKQSMASADLVGMDGLNAAARALVRADFSPDELPTILRVEIQSLQRETGQEVAFRDGQADGVWFTLIDRRPRSYVNVRKPNQVRFLAGNVNGVWMVVNLHKPGTYRHENTHVAQALRALAAAIERAAVPLADHDMGLHVGD